MRGVLKGVLALMAMFALFVLVVFGAQLGWDIASAASDAVMSVLGGAR